MFKSRRSKEDFAEEIRSHLELESDELKAEGLSEAEAQRRARVHFGNVQSAKERFELRYRVQWLDRSFADVRFGLRQCSRSPGFAAVVVLVLALGIGASLAIFAFVDAALLKPLPYADPTRLMQVSEGKPEAPNWPLSYKNYLDWQRLNRSFVSLDIYSGIGFLLRTGSGAEPVAGERVSGGFLRTLGVTPIVGRDFNVSEGQLGGPNVAMLSYGAWVNRFNARQGVVGEAVDLDGVPYTVIGVLPKSFVFAPGGNAEVWVPINKLSFHEQSRNFYTFMGIGRIKDRVTAGMALSDLHAIAIRLLQQYPAAGQEANAAVTPLAQIITGDVRPILLVLLAGSGLLLLIACVNVASLMLVRSESRRREVAVRSALGATPARLIRQFITESLLLTVTGGLGGVGLAYGLIQMVKRVMPKNLAAGMPFLMVAGWNARTTAFVVVVIAGVALTLAAVPICRLVFQKVSNGLAEGGRGSAGRGWRRMGANMVVLELAVTVMLLAGAGLLGKSLYRLMRVPLGFDPEHIATLQVTAPKTTYATDEQITGLYREIRRRVSGMPGVTSVGMTSMLPVQCDCSTDSIRVEGRQNNRELNEVDERHISPGYMRTLRVPLIRGRDITEDDNSSHPNVAIINRTLARKLFANEDPIGQRLADEEGGHPTVWQIVGVVEDIREGALDAAVAPTEYFPLSQARQSTFRLVVKTSSDASALLPSLASTLHSINPDIGTSDEATMNQKISLTQAALLHRFTAWIVGGFAALALTLGVVGLYGVVAFSVSQRTREIGVRMALGAQRSTVYRKILGEAGSLTLIGLVLGLICSLATSVLMRKLFFGVAAWDVVNLIGVSALLGLATFAASYVPARRAASINPTEALRTE